MAYQICPSPALLADFSSLLRFFAGVQSSDGHIAGRRERPNGGPPAMEGAHDLLNDFQGEAKLNGMVRPLP